jgi:terpene synthase-like protein
MYPEATSYILPDLLALSTPFKGSTNPHYAKAAPESQAWVVNHHVFNDRKGAFFRQCYFELLASHTFPYADYEEFRTICDFVNLIFVIDEVSDDQSGVGARETGQAYLNALRYPGWTDGSPIAKMTAEYVLMFIAVARYSLTPPRFRERLTRSVGPRSFRRYVTHSENYIACTSREADYRETGEMLELEPYKNHRRENSAIQLCFALFEYCLGIDLPDEVFEDPVFARLYRTAADMVWLANVCLPHLHYPSHLTEALVFQDLYSYNMEQAKGHPANNIVTVLMRDRNCDLQGAMDIIGHDYADFMESYLADKERLPSFGPKVDAEVQRYITAMENWPIGNLEWSFGTNRYFGPMHDEVRRTRLVMVTPRRDDSDDNSD